MGEDAKDEEEDEDADDGGNAAAPPAPAPLAAAAPKEIIMVEDPIEMVPEQEAPMAHEVILADAESELPQPHLYHTHMSDYEESPPRMMDDMDDPNDEANEDRSDMDEWFPEDGSNDTD
jgi:hypothetical protein